MENLVLSPTSYTPAVNFDCKTGILELTGTSTPEDSGKFFNPLIEWMEFYSQQPASSTTLVFKMEYFNTSSTVFMLRLMKSVVKLGKEGCEVSIKWFHEKNDEDFIEAGKDFGALAKTDIELISLGS